MTVSTSYNYSLSATHLSFSCPNSVCILPTAPDHVTSLRADPDIVSIAVSWEPPAVARDGLVTGYEVCSRPADVQFLNCDPLLNGYSTQTRVRDLQPDSLYVVTVKAVIDGNKGPVEETMARTSAIGETNSMFTLLWKHIVAGSIYSKYIVHQTI